MRPVVMASVCVLGFISFSPTYPDRKVSGIRLKLVIRQLEENCYLQTSMQSNRLAGRNIWSYEML